MHNGFVGGWPRLRRRIEALIPDELFPSRIVTTDSEALFLAIVGAGIDEPVSATGSVLGKVSAMVDEAKQPFRFTAALSNGRDLYAFRYSLNDSANTLYYREYANEILVVSEPIDRDHSRWISVPNNTVLIARLGAKARMQDVQTFGLRAAAE
jgi:predicted glutamine amidotransferase